MLALRVFSLFIPWLAVPGMEVEHLGGSRRGKRDHEKKGGLHYFTAGIGELKSRRLLFIFLVFCRPVNLELSLC